MTTESQPPNHLINQSVVRFSSGSMTGHAYSNTVDTPVVGPIITILKKANMPEASLGQVITYRLLVANKGNLDAQVTLLDPMPDGTSFVPNSVIVAGVPIPLANPAQGIPLGTVHVGQSCTVIFQIVVLKRPHANMIRNQAFAPYTFRTPSGREVSGQSRSNTVLIPFKRVKIKFCKMANLLDTYVGDTVTFRFTIVNEEENAIPHLLFQDALTPGMTFLPGSVILDDIRYPSANPMEGIWLGTLPDHTSFNLQFQAAVSLFPQGGFLENAGVLSYEEGDYRNQTTSNTVMLRVFDPNLRVVESVQEAAATLGDVLTYTVTLTNTGNIAAEVSLTEFLPEGTSYVASSLTVNGQPYDKPQLPNPLPLGTLTPGTSVVVTFQVSVNTIAISASQKELVSHAVALFNYRLPDGRGIANRLVSNDVHVALLQPNVDVQMRVHPLAAEPGEVLAYMIAVTNTGSLTAEALQMWSWISTLNTLVPGSLHIRHDSLPEKLSIHAADGRSIVPAQPLVIGDLGPQTSIEITYELEIPLDPHASRIATQAEAKYSYQVNELVHAGSVLSNPVIVRIEHADE
ncbi:hypothetical protein [Paenibacillus ferrarius]|uniref:hypothetical protein n=1 Tax=Paenibacillus ferrarius TaxID=1469647 RepID=UPI003D2CD870